MIMAEAPSPQFVVCIAKDGCAASLAMRKIYVVIPDAAAERQNLIRVIDESGEDYLYPKSLFRAISLSPADSRAVLAAI